MKAYQISGYNKGKIEMQQVEIVRPSIRPTEVLIQVKCAGVNPLDNMIARGEVRLVTPYEFPLTMGNECSGTIVQVGEDVHGFAIGDRVFARLPIRQIGAFAEYVATPASAIAHIPEGLSFAQAASIPLTALTAYQALELMQPKPGASLFVSGGSGGLGAMAIPLAKARGLVVYTNGNPESRERVLALGADRYLDYRKEDYLGSLPPVDYVLDSLGGDALTRQIQLLREGGHIVSLRGLPNGTFAKRFGLPTWKRWLFSLVALGIEREARRRRAKYDFLFVESHGGQLAEIAQLIEERGIRPSIDSVFTFDQANDALAKVASRGSVGKVIISLE